MKTDNVIRSIKNQIWIFHPRQHINIISINKKFTTISFGALKLTSLKDKIKKEINKIIFLNILKKKKFIKPIIGGYFPVNFEIDCLHIIQILEKQGLKVSLPVIKKNNQILVKYTKSKNKIYTEEFDDVLFVPNLKNTQ